MISVRSETYAFFGQKLPKGFTEPRPGAGSYL